MEGVRMAGRIQRRVTAGIPLRATVAVIRRRAATVADRPTDRPRTAEGPRTVAGRHTVAGRTVAAAGMGGKDIALDYFPA